jgi:anti-sigma factor RsiW
MTPTHLSDEAVAAFADGVLSGRARERAARHVAECPECAYAVTTQREAVWALRAAPAPSLPSGLLDRLRLVPETTPIEPQVPAAAARDGSGLMAAFAQQAAFAPRREDGERSPAARIFGRLKG